MADVKKIMLVFGTRPEAIKMAPLVLALQKAEVFQPIVCVTGQHRQMLDQVLEVFGIRADIDLNIMQDKQDLTDITSNVLSGMREVFNKDIPDMVLVHGDTATTMAASLAAFYAQVPLGHVEAGLRSYNISAPFPEECNRRVTSIVTTLHFAPTEKSRDQLLSEHVPASHIVVTGNTVIDALYFMLQSIEADIQRKQSIDTLLSEQLSFDYYAEKFILITGHRRENFGSGFKEICRAVKHLAKLHPDTHFVYPVHLNPNVKDLVYHYLSGITNIHLIKPLGYAPFVWLLKHCYMVLTDSGGIQEEGPSLRKPVLVMRDVTERPEAIDAWVVKLVGADFNKITEGVSQLIEDSAVYEKMAQAVNPYGDGNACERIIASLRNADI